MILHPLDSLVKANMLLLLVSNGVHTWLRRVRKYLRRQLGNCKLIICATLALHLAESAHGGAPGRPRGGFGGTHRRRTWTQPGMIGHLVRMKS